MYLYGTWKNFQVAHKLQRSANPPYFFETTLYLLSGTHEYKYLVDNVWMYDMNEKTVRDGHGSFNNVIEVIPRR